MEIFSYWIFHKISGIYCLLYWRDTNTKYLVAGLPDLTISMRKYRIKKGKTARMENVGGLLRSRGIEDC